jgi:hypothetical protein
MIHYLLWSNKHQMWWRPDGRGYTEEITEAGAYTEARAVSAVTQSALCQDRTKVTLMVAAPPGWVPPADEHVFGPGPLVDVLAAFIDSRVQEPGSPTGEVRDA